MAHGQPLALSSRHGGWHAFDCRSSDGAQVKYICAGLETRHVSAALCLTGPMYLLVVMLPVSRLSLQQMQILRWRSGHVHLCRS